MNRGLYIGATSLLTNQRRMDVLSNNLANINTTGYKRDISISESFPEKLLVKESRLKERRQTPKEDNFRYEALDNNLHRASLKEGFFRIETPIGISHVKEMEYLIDEDGFLKTSYINLDNDRKTDYENYILDRNGNRIQNPGNIENLTEQIVFTPKDYAIGTMSAGVNFKRVHTDFTQGGFIDTEGKFDVALMGNGFFKIQGDDGETLYTRNGNFTINQNNHLVDLDGRRVLGTNGPITLQGSEVNISENGTITVDGQNVGNLDIVTIGNSEFLRKVGDNNFKMAMNVNGEEIGAEEGNFEGKVLQGHLETSNMNPINGMVEMITLLRDFEANQKVVKMQDEMLEKAATEIGRT